MYGDKHRTFTKDLLNPLGILSAPFKTIRVALLKCHTPSRGFNYVLVIIDSFSKFIIIKAIKIASTVPKEFI